MFDQWLEFVYIGNGQVLLLPSIQILETDTKDGHSIADESVNPLSINLSPPSEAKHTATINILSIIRRPCMSEYFPCFPEDPAVRNWG